MIDDELRAALHDRLGPALDELAAPDLLSGVRVRQARYENRRRAGVALTSIATVAVVVTAAVLWPRGDSLSPSGPLLSAVPPSPGVSATPTAASSAEPSVAPVAPLVTSGPCAGLNVAAYLRPPVPRHPVMAVQATETVLDVTDSVNANLAAKGPCVDRLWYVPRTSAIQGANGVDQPSPFQRGMGWIQGRPTAANQTAVVQLFLDCKGLVCSGSGAPLATITVHVEGSTPGAASAPFPSAPSSIPLPAVQAIIVPSVVGMTVGDALRVLLEDGLQVGCSCSGELTDTRIVTGQDLPPGTTAHRGGASISITAAGPAPRPSFLASPTGTVAQPPPGSRSAGPSLPHAAGRVPSLVGLSVDKAVGVLANAGITYQLTYRYASAPKGIVTYQNPEAGAAVVSRTVVRLSVALGPRPTW
jgi:hypothetical protein